MRKFLWLIMLGLAGSLGLAPAAWGQARPYIGFVYPAGGQQGNTFQIRLGGQGMDDVNAVIVSGEGVSTRVVENLRRLNNQEVQLLGEQLKDLKRASNAVPQMMMMSENTMMMSSSSSADKPSSASDKQTPTQQLISRIEKRTREFVQTPACASISSLVVVEVTISPEAAPGGREIRLATARGVSNPLAFHVGQVPEFTRKPMLTATIQTLGKEAAALRKRPPEEAEVEVAIPCTVNGQIASGEVNRYRVEARKGQRLVITTLGRQLIPFIADAVPGWFQPVLALYDANGKELAYDDDYRFKPDPTIFYEVPKDGEYVFDIHDSIYRGREDFVYRITIGELPFVTSIFPLGGRIGEQVTPKIKGWNLEGAEQTAPAQEGANEISWVTAKNKGYVSNRVPFEWNKLPEALEKEPNDDQARAQKVTLPTIVNGRISKADDWDVFQFTGKSNQTVVADVHARRLDSPLDSLIKLTDATGAVLAFNDDHEDLGAGANTHHADSYLLAKLPEDGTYFLHIGDTARSGGEAYAYRLRLSTPQPDFALRVVPSSISLRGKTTGTLSVYVIREDGFSGPIKLSLKNPPAGFSAAPVTISGTATVARVVIKSDTSSSAGPVNLSVIGSAKINEAEFTREAVPAEDRMQAFLWRHLVPAAELKALVFDQAYVPKPKRIAPALPASLTTTNAVVPTNVVATVKTATTNASPRTNTTAAAKPPKFTKQQIAGRLRQLKSLFEEGYLTEAFYLEKAAECTTAQ